MTCYCVQLHSCCVLPISDLLLKSWPHLTLLHAESLKSDLSDNFTITGKTNNRSTKVTPPEINFHTDESISTGTPGIFSLNPTVKWPLLRNRHCFATFGIEISISFLWTLKWVTALIFQDNCHTSVFYYFAWGRHDSMLLWRHSWWWCTSPFFIYGVRIPWVPG